MITKLTTQKILSLPINAYWFGKLVPQGKSLVAELPTVNFPVRQKTEDEDRFNKRHIYDLNGMFLLIIKSIRKKTNLQGAGIMLFSIKIAFITFIMLITMYLISLFQPIGRMVGQIATAIRGKNSPLYRNSVADVKNGDVCIIVNAADPLFTGKKL